MSAVTPLLAISVTRIQLFSSRSKRVQPVLVIQMQGPYLRFNFELLLKLFFLPIQNNFLDVQSQFFSNIIFAKDLCKLFKTYLGKVYVG